MCWKAAVGDSQKKGKKKAKKGDKEKKPQGVYVHAEVRSVIDSPSAPVPAQANDEKEAAPAAPVDDDPDGLKLINTPKPLEEAAKLVRPLENLQPQDIRVWAMDFDLALRRGMC